MGARGSERERESKRVGDDNKTGERLVAQWCGGDLGVLPATCTMSTAVRMLSVCGPSGWAFLCLNHPKRPILATNWGFLGEHFEMWLVKGEWCKKPGSPCNHPTADAAHALAFREPLLSPNFWSFSKASAFSAQCLGWCWVASALVYLCLCVQFVARV